MVQKAKAGIRSDKAQLEDEADHRDGGEQRRMRGMVTHFSEKRVKNDGGGQSWMLTKG